MTEGEKFRGTTSVWRILAAFSLTPSSNGLRAIGRTRLPLLLFKEATPGGNFSIDHFRLAPPGGSLNSGSMDMGLPSLCYRVILTKVRWFVKPFDDIPGRIA